MSSDYNYDEQGQFFPYFVLTMLALVVTPVTYTTFAPSRQGGLKLNPQIESDFKPPNHDQIEVHKKKKAKESRRLKRTIFIVLGWALAGYMVYLIATTQTTTAKIWDPYRILGVPMSYDEKKIKSHYRRLSLTLHPDKARPQGNETAQDLNDRWVEITKAYKALTDEEIRRNFQEFGHPDGKQAFSMGIALPQWTVAAGSRWFVLAFYGLMFGMVLPYIVGKWWYGTKKFTKDGVLTEVAGRLFKQFDEEMDESDMVNAVSVGGLEKFKKDKSTIDDDVQLEKVLEAHLTPQKKKNLASMEPWRRKTASLIWAHLYRSQVGNSKLDSDKLDVAQEAVNWNNASLSIALAYSMTKPILSSMHFNQCLVQAIPPNGSPLLQLPYFDDKVVASVEGGTKDHWTIQKFMSLSAERRKKLCVGEGLLTEAQYISAMEVAVKIPVLHVEKAFFKVQGEKFITPNAIIQLVVKARVVPAGVTPPPVDPKDLVDEDPAEDDIDALIGRDHKKQIEPTAKSAINSNEVEKSTLVTGVEAPKAVLTHAPFFPAAILPRWHIFLADAKTGRMIIAPTTISQFPETTDNFKVQTLKLQFGAPPNAGDIPFVMHLVCDAYLGTDIKMNIDLHVDNPEAVERIVEDDEISEPDEDSIAGQMQALKSGVPAPKRKKAIKGEEDDSSDYESNTEGEEEENSDTDTDTDTDED